MTAFLNLRRFIATDARQRAPKKTTASIAKPVGRVTSPAPSKKSTAVAGKPAAGPVRGRPSLKKSDDGDRLKALLTGPVVVTKMALS